MPALRAATGGWAREEEKDPWQPGWPLTCPGIVSLWLPRHLPSCPAPQRACGEKLPDPVVSSHKAWATGGGRLPTEHLVPSRGGPSLTSEAGGRLLPPPLLRSPAPLGSGPQAGSDTGQPRLHAAGPQGPAGGLEKAFGAVGSQGARVSVWLCVHPCTVWLRARDCGHREGGPPGWHVRPQHLCELSGAGAGRACPPPSPTPHGGAGCRGAGRLGLPLTLSGAWHFSIQASVSPRVQEDSSASFSCIRGGVNGSVGFGPGLGCGQPVEAASPAV